MPRFHFVIHDGIRIDDPWGMVFESEGAAARHAKELARLIALEGDEAGEDRSTWRIVVRDDAGRLRQVVRFADVINGSPRFVP